MARREETDADLNLLPVMNLFVVLIPFLLMGISFLQIGALSASTPVATMGGEDNTSPPTVVYVSVDASQMRVSIEPGPKESAQWDTMEHAFDRTEGTALNSVVATLEHIKTTTSTQPTLILVPDGAIPYADVIEVMSRVRPIFPQITVTRLARAS